MTNSEFPMEGQRPSGANLVAKTFEDGGKHYTALSASFLLVCLYVLVTVSSTTHRHLLLGGSLPLPLLNASIPLKGFFVVSPALVLVLHVHLLLQHHVLLQRLRDQRLEELGGGEDFLLFPALPVLGELWCDRLWVRILLRSALLMINAVLPLGILLFTQYKFVPYHSRGITASHQLFVLLDVLVIWYFLVSIPHRQHGAAKVIVTIALGVILLYSLVFAVVPGTGIERLWNRCPVGNFEKCSARNLKLPGELLVVEPPPAELLASYEARGEDRMLAFVTFSAGARLMNRDLRGADLEGAKLFNADLRGANLQGASLVGADLRRANLTPPGESALMEEPSGSDKSNRIEALDEAKIRRTNLEQADLRDANLIGAKLILVNMVKANLQEAKLSGVELTRANLREANLQEAELDGAELSFATLDGARMKKASLREAKLFRASLEGAVLHGTQASAAIFAEADLKGANLVDAVFGGGDFRNADLAGSDLRGAFLPGAKSLHLESVDLRGAHTGGALDLQLLNLVDLRYINPVEWYVVIDSPLRITKLPILSGRYLLYSEENRQDGWPPLAKQSQKPWNERVFHSTLAADLLRRACVSEGLATTLVRRAAGKYNPGDLDFDLELAKQLLEKLGDPHCKELLAVPPHIKRQIAWRLRMKDRAEAPLPEEVSRPTTPVPSSPPTPPASSASPS